MLPLLCACVVAMERMGFEHVGSLHIATQICYSRVHVQYMPILLSTS